MTESIHPEIHPEYIRGFQNGLSAHAEKQQHEIAPHSSENWDDEAWVRSFLQMAREWKPVGQWPGPKVLDAIERLAFGDREVRGVTVLFGLGAFIVNTGTSDGQPAVFVDDAPEPGQVGSKAPNVPAETVPRLRLLFPTAEQAKRVADALVTAQPAGGDGVRERCEATPTMSTPLGWLWRPTIGQWDTCFSLEAPDNVNDPDWVPVFLAMPDEAVAELIEADKELDRAQEAYADNEDHRRTLPPDEWRRITNALDSALQRRAAALARVGGGA